MIRDHAPARRLLRRLAVSALLSSLAIGLSTAASAGSELSPMVRIVVLEAGATPSTLRLGVRKRNALNYDQVLDSETLDTEVRNFNPATCVDVQSDFLANGAAAPAKYDYFDIQLNASGRSAEEQTRLLNAVVASFVTSRDVRLYVRDDLCSSAGGRVVAGIVVQ